MITEIEEALSEAHECIYKLGVLLTKLEKENQRLLAEKEETAGVEDPGISWKGITWK